MSKKTKREYAAIARDLFYDRATPNIFELISAAETESELDRIMVNARHASARRDREIWH